VALLACGAAYRKKRKKVIPFLSRSSGQVIFLSRAKVSDLTFMLRSGSPLPSALEGKKEKARILPPTPAQDTSIYSPQRL